MEAYVERVGEEGEKKENGWIEELEEKRRKE